MDNYESYLKKKQENVILEKNKDKKVELEVWLAYKYGLDLNKLV